MFKHLIKISRSPENVWPLFVRNSKIMEEVGEFSEALMHKMGYLPHKTMKESLIGEAADVFITVMDTLAHAYPDMTPEELDIAVKDQIALKAAKWVSVMAVRHINMKDTYE